MRMEGWLENGCLYAAVRNGRWYWGLGDPDLGAVLVTGLYFLTAVMCLVVARRLGRREEGVWSQTFEAPSEACRLLTADPVSSEPVSSESVAPPHPASGRLHARDRWRKRNGEASFWLVLAVMLFCLGVNKQTDLQSLLTLYGPDLLRELDLYDVRRTIQVAFIVGVAAAAAGSVALGLWMARRWSWPCRFAAVGMGIQAAFIVIRATSFHHVDRLLGWRLGDLKFNLLLESIGLVVILMAVLFCLAQRRAAAT